MQHMDTSPSSTPRLVGTEQTPLLEVLGDEDDGVLDTSLYGFNVNLGLLRSLVWGADAGEVLDYTGSGLLVQALGITLLGVLDGNVNIDLDERKGLVDILGALVQLASLLAVGLVGRDEGRQGQAGRVGKQLGDLCDTADVLVARLLVEAEVLVQAEAHVVAVEAVGREAALQEVLLERFGNGGLARSRQAREPDGGSLLFTEGVALCAGEAGVPGDVARGVLVLANWSWNSQSVRRRNHLRGHFE